MRPRRRASGGLGRCLAAFGAACAILAGCEIDNEICGPEDGALAVQPSSLTLDARKTNIVELAAIGGRGDYGWSMNSGGLGILRFATTNHAVAIYQNTTNTGVNIVTVRDADGDTANTRIIQK